MNITLNFRLHTFACKSDNWRSVENITLENFRLHTFACKSDNWRSVENIPLTSNYHFYHVKVIIGMSVKLLTLH